MNFLINLALLLSVVTGLAAMMLVFNFASGWTQASKWFGPPPTPTVYWAQRATCVGHPFRFPVSVGACERGLVITPSFGLRWVTPTLWAPWDEIELHGPHWHWGTYEDLAIRGFELALPATIGDRIRGAKRGWKPLDALD